MCKVSVIVPVYNVENYLPKCIDSICNQTETELEIILVDDGSTDGCGAICDRYAEKDARIRVIHQQNSGLGAARNTGIRAATAEYLLFVDSDDYIESNLVEKAYSASIENRADIVMFGFQRVYEDGRVDFAYDFPASLADKKGCSLKNTPELLLVTPGAWNKLYKKALFDGITFPPRAWYEDLRTIPKLYSKANSIYCIGQYFPYKYLLRENSIMHNGNPQKTVAQRVEAVDSITDYFREVGLYEQYKQELLWLYIYHGYFLPCREIMNFQGKTKPFLMELRKNLLQKLAKDDIKTNPYFDMLSKREKLIFSLLYSENYFLLKCFVHINRILK